MIVIDAQVHIWPPETPDRPYIKKDASKPHRPVPLGPEELLHEMAVAGVDRAICVPPSWEGYRNDFALEAVCSYPDHFAVMGKLPLNDPSGEPVMADWTKQPGMLGFRVSFRHAGTHSWLDDGTADWFWAGRALRSSGNGLCAIRSAENRRDRRTSSGTSIDRRSYGTKHTAPQ